MNAKWIAVTIAAVTLASGALLRAISDPHGQKNSLSPPLESSVRDTQDLDGSSGPRPRAVDASVQSAELAADLALGQVRPRDGRNVDPSQYSSAEELLSDYCGAEWPAVRATLGNADFSDPIWDLVAMPPFAQVEPQMADDIVETIANQRESMRQEMAQWNNIEDALAMALDGSSIPELSGQQRRNAQDKIETLNKRIWETQVNWYSGLETSMLDALGRPEISPVHPLVFPRTYLGYERIEPQDYLWVETKGSDGWNIEFVLKQEDYPSFASWSTDLEAALAARTAFLKALASND